LRRGTKGNDHLDNLEDLNFEIRAKITENFEPDQNGLPTITE